MSFKLNNVVPWGRSFVEYTKMFSLTKADLDKKILDCAGGPASFNAEMNYRGNKVISCDPIYQFTEAEIRSRIQETTALIVAGLQASLDRFVWQEIESPLELSKLRMEAMDKFLTDFSQGKVEGRYLSRQLPELKDLEFNFNKLPIIWLLLREFDVMAGVLFLCQFLPFPDNSFDLALCSHFLFTYSEQLSGDFHLTAILELCRVAKEVRIFPLLENFTGEASPYIQPVIEQLREKGYEARIEKVAYEFQQGGNEMLLVSLPARE
ncbi:MAG: hypothetical protein WA865_04350 [Spirulinaceae cyanobacterium]